MAIRTTTVQQILRGYRAKNVAHLLCDEVRNYHADKYALNIS